MTRAQVAFVSQTAVLLAALVVTGRLAEGATVAGGNTHTLVIRTTDGAVFAWGANSDGQIGDNTTTQRKTPVQASGISGVVAVAAGAKHSLALTSGGVLWAWGDNAYGQIGNGNNTDQKLPVQVMTGVSQIAAGDSHSIALKSDGTLWSWGANSDGQLADGGTTNRNTPGSVTGLGGVNAIGAGGNHTLVVLAAGGAMKSWGKNTNGQLGDGSTYARATSPVSVAGLLDATGASAGVAFSLARRFDGSVHAWGLNSNGQLGQGDTTQRTSPTLIGSLPAVAAVAAGGSHALALLSDGTLAAWGHNSYGSVGDGSGAQRTSPVAVPGLASVVAIGAGQYHSVAVTGTGEVWTWGYNNQAQVGDGTTANRLSPVKIAEAGFNWKAATPTFSPAPGQYSANQNLTIACATSGATIRYTTDGSDPTTSSPAYSSAVAITVSTTLKARAFKSGLADSNVASGVYTLKVATPSVSPAAGTYTTPQSVTLTVGTSGATIRYTTDGTDPTGSSPSYAGAINVATTTTLKAAGFKAGWTTSDLRTATYTMNFGTLAAPGFSPAPAGYVDSVSVTITATPGATIRYTTNGSTPTLSSTLYTSPVNLTETTTLKAKAWKVDYTESPVSTASYTVKVATPLLSLAPGTYPAATTVTLTAATAGAALYYTLDGSDPTESDTAIASGGSLVVGNYTLKLRSFKTGCDPSDVVSATYAASGQLTPGMVSAGEAFSLALLPDGTAWSWGYNAGGRLGDGTTTNRSVPGPVEGLTGIVAIAAGSNHGLALDAGGAVWSWGTNNSGQLGDGTTTTRSQPAPVPGLTGAVAIAAGEGFSAALRDDGSLWMWGENAHGELGVGDTVDRLSPVAVLSGVARVAAGWFHVLAAKVDGGLWSWGYNASGQLGDGTTTGRLTPAPVSGVSSVVRVAAGQSHSMAQTAGGSSYAWGANSGGQVGDGTKTARLTPTLVGSLVAPLGLDCGSTHSLALAPDATALAWGENGYGQIGDGTTTDQTSPVTLAGLLDVVSVAGGDQHSLAMGSDGSIWAWGGNGYGRLGDGTTQSRLTPVKIRDGGSWRVATPTLSPAGGSFTAAQAVTIAVATPGATIRYTTNGADPTASDSTVMSGASIAVDVSQTVKAKAWKPSWADSAITAEQYALTVATPTLTPGAGTYDTPQTVTVATSTPAAAIHYTTNGADPTPGDPQIASGGTILVDGTRTLRAKAWKVGWSESATVSRSYNMVVGTPVASPSGGSHGSALVVQLSTVTPGATIRYTTSGLEPGPADEVGTSVLVDRSLTLKAVASRPGWTSSATSVDSYWLTLGTVAAPTFSPPEGAYAGPRAVNLASSTPGATIRYTTDGSEPTPASSIFSAPLLITNGATLKARAFKDDYTPSATATAVYSLDPGSAAPALVAPPGGAFAGGLRARITTQTAGATLRYTTDGTDPEETDPIVASGGDLAIERSLRLKVRAFKTGLAPSAVTVADYHLVGAASAGLQFSLVLAADGTVWSFGANSWGQLGNGGTETSLVPVQVLAGTTPLNEVVAVAAGALHGLALTADGRVWSWGANNWGQLGDGSMTPRSSASEVLTPTGVLTDIVGVAAGDKHSLALDRQGRVWSWGSSSSGQVGNGATASRTRAEPLSGVSGIVAIAAGGDSSLAVSGSNSLWVWGRNVDGQLGDGSTANRLLPVKVAAGVKAAACGGAFILRQLLGGSVLGTGANEQGQLGDGSSASPRIEPVATIGSGDISAIELGSSHTLLLRTDGSVRGTGRNVAGQVGNGTTETQLSLVPAEPLDDAVGLAAGGDHSLAVDHHGRVFAWGENSLGQLGLGDTKDRRVPTPLPGFAVASTDPDGDGLSTQEELALGTDPFVADTNHDGISDGTAFRAGLSMTDADMDDDGVANGTELAAGTDPFRSDSDEDGVSDAADCYPRDPSRSACLPPDPLDSTPPALTLVEPAGAVLISSLP